MAQENKSNAELSKDLDEIASDLKLTNKQKIFCEAYFFITNRDPMEAFDLAGYTLSTKRESFDSDEVYEKYLNMEKTRRCTDVMNVPRVRKYITAIKCVREEYITVDKFWVIKKLKHLADNAPENVQLNATKLLGQNLDMFNNTVNLHTDLERPDKAMKKIWERRKARDQSNKDTETSTQED